MKYTIFACLLLLFSCQKEKSEIDSNHIHFKSTSLAEVGDPDYEVFEAKAESSPVVKYVGDEIFVTLIAETFACNQYYGNAKIKNDTIILGYEYLTQFPCKTRKIDKFSYIIDNPQQNKKYKIVFQPSKAEWMDSYQ